MSMLNISDGENIYFLTKHTGNLKLLSERDIEKDQQKKYTKTIASSMQTQ
jgi:hypothetical protein